MRKSVKSLLICAFFSFFPIFYSFSGPIYGFRIYLSDKANSTYSVDKPEEYLSQRAIDKRTRYNIAITEEDLPVNQSYISQIAAIDTAVKVWSVSKWTNTLTILCADTHALGDIRALDFVTGIRPVGVYYNNPSKVNKNVVHRPRPQLCVTRPAIIFISQRAPAADGSAAGAFVHDPI